MSETFGIQCIYVGMTRVKSHVIRRQNMFKLTKHDLPSQKYMVTVVGPGNLMKTEAKSSSEKLSFPKNVLHSHTSLVILEVKGVVANTVFAFMCAYV